jgi:DNA-binding MarR family transcriptional regulator
VNLDTFDKLDRVIHERGRMAITSLLAAAESLSFKELKEQLKMTDGNLSVHMRTLEESGYVAVAKSFVNRKPRTDYSLTPEGREAFQSYIRTLEQIVQQAQRLEKPVKSAATAAGELPAMLKRGMAPAK